MSDREILKAIADALDSAAGTVRQHIALLDPPSAATDPNPTRSAVERAKAMHAQLGPRQAEVIEQLEQAGSGGTGTGAIVRAIGYDQPDVYLTLKGLLALDFAEKDASTRPHTYRLGPRLRGK